MHTKNKLHSGKHEVNEARWQKQSWPHLMTKKGNEQSAGSVNAKERKLPH